VILSGAPISLLENRVLVLVPPGPDFRKAFEYLSADGLEIEICGDIEELCHEVQQGVGVLVMAGDVLAPAGMQCLIDALGHQPAWSDIPIVVFAREERGPDHAWSIFRDLNRVGSVTLIDMPIRPVPLVSAVKAALRARRAQYELRDNQIARESQENALRRSEEALREADRRKDDFLAMLAHELRNPLGPIRNAVHVLEIIGPHETDTTRVRRMIDRQVAHMARLLDDLLDVSRITCGRINLRLERIDLAQLVRSAVEDHRGGLEARGLQLTTSVPLRPLWIMGDSIRITQVLANLIDNAGKFTAPGGRVFVGAWHDEDREMATVTVRDSGIGMEAEMLEHIFDSFTQADRSLDRSQGGLGLGLALVRGLVDLHGGKAEAHSDGLGRGSQFTVSFSSDRAPDSSRESQSDPADRSVFRILIVEDNVDAAESMGVLLGLVGHTVMTAHTGSSGIEKAREFRPHVVLCDIGLPDGMDGYAVARALRESEATRQAYLIALTGYGQEEDQERARQAGFDLHLTKPVDPGSLKTLLSRPLKRSFPGEPMPR
jgi:signal transduction histidine kinase/ActR/RegA family two-component response regulator